MYKYINFQKIYEDLAVQQTIDSMATSQETVKLNMTMVKKGRIARIVILF